MAVSGPTTKFNYHQHLQLYGTKFSKSYLGIAIINFSSDVQV